MNAPSFFQFAADHFDVFPQEDVEPVEEAETESACPGHESFRGDLMGEAFYCDSSCVVPKSFDTSDPFPG